MAIFKKTEPQAPKSRDRPPTSSRGGTPDGAISIIGSGMRVVGDIATEGIVRVEGEVHGTIRAGKAVILGQTGLIEGNVYTDDAVIGGRVSGSVVAESRLELQATCSVEGEIQTRPEHLKLEEGARFAGQVHMIETPSDGAGENPTSIRARENIPATPEEATARPEEPAPPQPALVNDAGAAPALGESATKPESAQDEEESELRKKA